MIKGKMSNRLYKSGTIWCFWRWTYTDSGYITRLHVLKTPWFAICLHWLNKPDPEPYLHDHPVSFLSLILRGGYTEKRQVASGDEELRIHRYYNYVPGTINDRHTIVYVEPNTVTLVFMGPKTREWGFHSRHRWIYWKDYYTAQRAEKKR
jgi:hypothetical protein